MERGTKNFESDDGNSRTKADAFWDMMEARQDQASRSLLVKVPNNVSLEDMLQYMNAEFGSVAHYFPHSQKDQGRYAIIEFHKEQSLKRIHQKTNNGHFLNLPISGSKKLVKSNENSRNWIQINRAVKGTELAKKLYTAKTDNKAGDLGILVHSEKQVSEQLELFYKEQTLQEPETRLRFLLCVLLEDAFHTILPDCHIYPFGSSVNGFGNRNCDVDMYLDHSTPRGIVPVRRSRADSYDLRYDKRAAKSDRIGTQLTLQALSTYLRKNVPHCYNVYDILHASCPLIKFRHLATGLSCDLTADNRLGLTSSELLYVYGQLDARVPQLVFLIRHWARIHNITSTNPGYWITNFPLTLLVIFFLQTTTPAVVPSLDYLCSISDTVNKSRVNSVGTSLVGDIGQVPSSTNKQSSESLLQEFFYFCATFDFEHKALSVRQGKAYPKPDMNKKVQFSLYIENPFETHLNTSKNVKDKLVQHIRERAEHALGVMTQSNYATPKEITCTEPSWGVPLLFHTYDEAQRRAESVMHMLGQSINDTDRVNRDHVIEIQDRHQKDTIKIEQLPMEDGHESVAHSGLKFAGTTEKDKKLDIKELELESDGMYTNLVHLFGQKHDIKVNFTFMEENVTSSRKMFKAVCHIGNFQTSGKGNTKKMAKHQAAKLMLLNLPPTFVRKQLK